MRLIKVLASILLLSSLSFGQESEKDDFECGWIRNKVDFYLHKSVENPEYEEYLVIWSYELLRVCNENTPEYKIVKKFLNKIEEDEK